MHRIQIVRLVLALTSTAVFAQGALAGGERKSEQPFTPRAVAPATNANAIGIDVRGEPKNQLPFTRRMAR